MSLVDVTYENFDEEVLQSEKPVLVDFYADWCGHCQRLSPVIDEISQELEDKLNVVKINVDNEPDLAMEYGVSGIPTIFLFQDGQVKESYVGTIEKDDLLAKINNVKKNR